MNKDELVRLVRPLSFVFDIIDKYVTCVIADLQHVQYYLLW